VVPAIKKVGSIHGQRCGYRTGALQELPSSDHFPLSNKSILHGKNGKTGEFVLPALPFCFAKQ
jgi:hypothetical protein